MTQREINMVMSDHEVLKIRLKMMGKGTRNTRNLLINFDHWVSFDMA